ncbi:MAG TPA: ABC-type transport auxiliary lipoprotein family protein, partial [Acetobacteraceae bacterium]|nr:ABC-type transport auxiliary lipoprotein family protein [Acetobacteraceae bacterium]
RRLLPDGAEHLDYWQEWAVPPPQGVGASLRQWLAASGLFTAVIQPGSDLRADFVLESELTGFAADSTAGRARATLSLVLLRRLRNGTSFPVMQRSLTGEAPLTGNDAPSIVHALLQALAALLTQVQAMMRSAISDGVSNR